MCEVRVKTLAESVRVRLHDARRRLCLVLRAASPWRQELLACKAWKCIIIGFLIITRTWRGLRMLGAHNGPNNLHGRRWSRQELLPSRGTSMSAPFPSDDPPTNKQNDRAREFRASPHEQIQIDPFFKFTIPTTRNSLFRFSPATLLSINRGELKYEGREEGSNVPRGRVFAACIQPNSHTG